ncbi:YifB family Mg chelatase-like AAA ATPase [Modestobacter sp. I12A-02628]|uniref:YifB family Mg chelatase-like AAA ATPase n=1 Tax=Goekera deserti TaxID=2497753 RepID=A0A7K3WH39_9ACTN|nr:YifB family Mg chelatase-like AAA ATPase [Goekera deserti]MPQ97259.1 YifB family Mg chelatase-like AAA ATPase [Goekera deserti]NDI50230.1 YifB family Mg chelatase-like AAA ATPase [Goekera deserti]NEL55798.1 YifB family Mg chelatase-like AAA ATPase [Goekera deserti]
MTLARTWSVGIVGVRGAMVEVEVDLASGLPGVVLVGLPDAVVRQSVDRVKAAVVNTGYEFPNRRVTIGLSPASMPKQGSGFDLALAVAVLAAAGVVPAPVVRDLVLLGEVGLDGSLRTVRGVLPAVVAASAAGHRQVVVPAGNADEAALVAGVAVLAATSLADVVAHLRGRAPLPAHVRSPDAAAEPGPDLADVLGQATGRRAVEIAAAGGHHVFFTGPPGAGKTMLAERLPGLLPALDEVEALEVTAVASIAGTLPPGAPLVTRPPFEAPHHSATMTALVGGGSGQIRPGALSRAHRGVLFLDEAPEFPRSVLDTLRQPLERGEVTIHRANGQATFPCRSQLVLAANPCPCATAAGDTACTCSPLERRRYQSRVSGPLLDRIDLRVDLPAVTRAAWLEVDRPPQESTAVVARRVRAARAAAAVRLHGSGVTLNGHVPGQLLRERWPVPRRALALAERALERGALSVRGFDRVLRVAWTVADLHGATVPDADHVAEALGMRLQRVAA